MPGGKKFAMQVEKNQRKFADLTCPPETRQRHFGFAPVYVASCPETDAAWSKALEDLGGDVFSPLAGDLYPPEARSRSAALPQESRSVKTPWLTLPEIAEYLSVAEGTVRNWVSQHRIPFGRSGRVVRFHQEKIDEWLSAGRGRRRSLRPTATRSDEVA